MYEPKNYVCANKDNLHLTIFDILSNYKNIVLRIVGRLDKDTTGLILLTNDGNWSHNLKAPKSNIEKEYEVILRNPISNLMIEKINSELILDNKKLKPIIFLQTGFNTCNIILNEGKYHQIKRMFHLVNNDVLELKRIRIGEFKLEEFNLLEGEWKKIKI